MLNVFLKTVKITSDYVRSKYCWIFNPQIERDKYETLKKAEKKTNHE